MIIDGKKIAEKIYDECAQIKPVGKYMAIFFGETSPATESFIKQKKIAADRVGIELRVYEFAEEKFQKVMGDPACGGIVIQLPLGNGYDTEKIISTIDPKKDVDNLTQKASIPAPAVVVVERVLEETGVEEFGNKKIVIIGKGRLVGAPVHAWAQKAGFEKIMWLDKGFDPQDLLEADIIVSGTGAAHIFSGEEIKKDACVIDFGYARGEDGKLKGDFNPEGEEYAMMYTPTPGGTGPVLVASLMYNFCILNR